MKNCPFCKKSIKEDSDKCPHCHCVLIERTHPIFTSYAKQVIKEEKKFKDYIHHIKDKFKRININSLNVYIPIIALIILIIFIVTQKDRSGITTKFTPAPVSVIPKDVTQPGIINNITPVQVKDPKNFISLPNGTIFSSNWNYFYGLGQLEINNGTNLDAVAKLVNTTTNKSVITVYIKAKSIYNLNKVIDGNYRLYFNLGNDWNTEIKAFNVNSSYEVFEEIFDFTTSKNNDGDYIHTRYSTFSVTLNPVVGGDAKTDQVAPIEFGNY